jgi:hypothetical protein
LEEQHKPFVKLNEQLGEPAGEALAVWARGGTGVVTAPADMTVRDLNQRARLAGISGATLRVVAAEMFPDRAATDLVSGELEQLWDAVSALEAQTS